jgi:hypothetical protein
MGYIITRIIPTQAQFCYLCGRYDLHNPIIATDQHGVWAYHGSQLIRDSSYRRVFSNRWIPIKCKSKDIMAVKR